jgi:hypothetical protein
MSIGFDNPGLLPLGVLVGLPLLIHLIARPRPRRLRFPSLMLLERAQRESVRLKRPRHWLLLILRTIWTALILAVFFQPRWFSQRHTEAATGRRSLVIVLDATASLRAREGAQSRYAQAVAEAVTLLRQLDPGDRANVIRARALPESFYPEPAVNRDYLIDEIRRRPCSLEGGSMADAVRLAAEQLAPLDGQREIVVLSDFQPLRDEVPVQLQAPTDIVLRTLSVASETVPNLAVTALHARPERPVSGRPFVLEATVHNHSDQPRRATLLFRIGERRESATLDLPPRATVPAAIELSLDAEGLVTASATLENDDFPADDSRHRVIPFHRALRIGVWGNDATARLWTRTLDALPETRAIDIQNLPALPDDLDALLLSGWRGEALPGIRAFSEKGGLLLFRPAEISPEMNEWLGLPVTSLRPERMDPPIGLRVPDPWPPLLGLFRNGNYGSPARGLISRHAANPVQDDLLEPVLSLENGETVWGRCLRAPAVYYWNLSLDPDDSDIAAQSEWVPMFGEGLLQAFRSSEAFSAAAGDLIPVPRDELPAETLSLRAFDGTEIPFTESEGLVRAQQPLDPGLYAWSDAVTGTPLTWRALHLPDAESDLRFLPPESSEGAPIGLLARADDWRAVSEGIALWPVLLALAFAFAAAEHFFTSREQRA